MSQFIKCLVISSWTDCRDLLIRLNKIRALTGWLARLDFQFKIVNIAIGVSFNYVTLMVALLIF
jgi:hypothetical protein